MGHPARRKLLLAAVAMLASPLSRAQRREKVWRVGFLATRRIGPLDRDFFSEFIRGMRELGYVEGMNLVIDWRSAEGDASRLPKLAGELVSLKVDVLVAAGAQAVAAAQKATAKLPIVMGTTGDPVGSGFVKTLARPGGNITGLSDISSDVSPKLLELLGSAVPGLRHIAVLVNPDNSSHVTLVKSIEAAARGAGMEVTPVPAANPQQIDAALPAMLRDGAKAAIITADALFNQQCQQIAMLAAKHRLPAISGFWQYVEFGGLMSYGQNFAQNFRRAAVYVDKIFKGANPGELPVEQPTKIEFLVNRRAASALGLKLPRDLLLRADRVIE